MSVDLHFLEPGAYLAVGISPQLLGGQVVEAPRFFKKLAHRVGSEISVRAKFGRNLLVAAASDGVGEQRGTLTGKRQGTPGKAAHAKIDVVGIFCFIATLMRACAMLYPATVVEGDQPLPDRALRRSTNRDTFGEGRWTIDHWLPVCGQ
jgi:hypothetical protein